MISKIFFNLQKQVVLPPMLSFNAELFWDKIDHLSIHMKSQTRGSPPFFLQSLKHLKRRKGFHWSKPSLIGILEHKFAG